MKIRLLAMTLLSSLALTTQNTSAAAAPSLLAQVNPATRGVEVYMRDAGGTIASLPLAPVAPCQATRSGRICTYHATDAGVGITATLQIAQSATSTQFRWLRVQSGGSTIVPLTNSVDVAFLGTITQAGRATTPPQGGWPSQSVQIDAVSSDGQTQITYTKPATCAGSPCVGTFPGFVPVRLAAQASGVVSVEAP